MAATLIALGIAIFGAFLYALNGGRGKSQQNREIESFPPDSRIPVQINAPEAQNSKPAPIPTPAVQSPTAPPAPSKPAPLLFDTPKHAFHSVRVICDETGLTIEQKNILCGCVYQESEFLTHPKPNQNKDKEGKVWSTDWGIVQVNDYYNVGPGKPFPTVQYVLDNPEKAVRWMARIMKTTGKLQPWASYTSGAYLKHLAPNSPMWALRG